METTTVNEYQSLLRAHTDYFHTGVTKPVANRIESLAKLKLTMKRYEPELMAALWQDLHKSENEAYTTEVGILYSSINHTVNNLKKWAKPERVGAPLMLFGTSSRIYREPYGTVLIIGPFNYPVNLVIEPLIGAVAAGNCVIINPSELTPGVNGVIRKIVGDAFDERHVRVVEGGRDVTAALAKLPFDYIFFTGGENGGKAVMKAAAENLVPVTLELGGKSPCIVDESADIDTAARKIVWGKFTNAGQTCVAPDYLMVHQRVKDDMVAAIRKYLERFYGTDPAESDDLGRIISESHTERLGGLIKPENVICGGDVRVREKYVAPTLLGCDSWDDDVMRGEIFGPLLPVMEFEDRDRMLREIRERPKPLALYLFTADTRFRNTVLETLSFGGGCINDVLLHAGNPNLPFGGIGASGIGSYHGKRSYAVFSHEKGILERKLNVESSVMYPPYDRKKLGMIKRMLK